MDQRLLDALEQRASEAESRIQILEEKLIAGSNVASVTADGQELQQLLALLKQAQEEQAAAQVQVKEAVHAKADAEKEVSKLRYQVLQLKRAVREVTNA